MVHSPHQSALSKLSTEDQSLTLRFANQSKLEDVPSSSFSEVQSRLAPFGTSKARFDPLYDCKLLFDRSPGPGSYNTTKDRHDFSEFGDVSDSDTILSIEEIRKRLLTDTS